MLIKNIDDMLVNGSLGKIIGFKTEAMFDVWNQDGYGSADEGRVEDVDAQMRKKIQAFTRELDTAKGAEEYPVVDFQCGDGTTRVILVKPEDWKVENPKGEVQASRTQLPLILAWAMSIHKSQGQTLERVRVDLSRVFEKGSHVICLL